MKEYLREAVELERSTPQNMPIPGRDMVENSAGGYTFALDDFARLHRFLILGSEGGTYYTKQRKLTLDNVETLRNCLRADPTRAIDLIVEISTAGRAPNNDVAIFSLAYAAAYKDADDGKQARVRQYALAQLSRVCRIGTHLFTFLTYVHQLRGWGKTLRKAVANWYLDRSVPSLSYQVIKYRQRNGWTHRDVLRMAHPETQQEDRNRLFHWVAQRASSDVHELGKHETLSQISAFESAQSSDSEGEVAALIREHDLPREAIPTRWLKGASAWRELLTKMPATALIRNLGNMTAIGVLRMGSDEAKYVAERLRDGEWLRKSRVHPVQILNALRVYSGGRRLRGGKQKTDGDYSWVPVSSIVQALDDAFKLAFQNVEPTGKNIMLALDVSASMGWEGIAGMTLTAREASAAMALVTAAVELNYLVTGFTATFSIIDITGDMRLRDAIDKVSSLHFGGTDCALPMLYAQKHRMEIDTFVIYTDNETWSGRIHPAQALEQYRQSSGRNAKLVVCGMTATGFSIADPDDAGMLDVVGFDTATPAIISEFGMGRI